MKARSLLWICATPLLAACGGGGGEQTESVRNDTQRQADQIAKQAEGLRKQAENGTAVIERALENESAIVFENRGNLLNEAASNETAPANQAR